MKYIIMVLLWTCSGVVYAQKIEEKNFEVSMQSKVVLELNYAGNIQVRTTQGNQVNFKATVKMTDEEGNSKEEILTWDYQEGSNKLEIRSEIAKKWMNEYNHFSSCNNQWEGDFKGKGLCVDIQYEIMIPKGVEVSVSTYSGDINLKGVSGPVYAKSLSGDVDMDWNTNQGASFELKSISGEVYEGLGLEVENLKENPMVGYKVKASYKNGGTALHLESVSGDVFLRKAE